MSSVVRSYAAGTRLPDPASFVMCTYIAPNEDYFPFPWRVDKQTLAIDLEFVNGFNSSTAFESNPVYARGQTLHASYNVRALGPNFVAWMEDSQSADAGSVVMTERPILCYANMLAPNGNPNSGGTFSSSIPITFESSAGSADSGFLKTMIFLKPLVVRYTVAGDTNYRCFTNNFEGNT